MKFAPLTCVLTVALLVAAVAIPALRQNAVSDSGQATACVLTANNWKEFAPQGKEVDAIYGDIVLRNEHLVAVIAQPLATRNANMTVKEVGGALIDFTTRQNQSDQLSAFYPGKRNCKYSKLTMTALQAKPRKQPGEYRPGEPTQGDSVQVLIEAPATDSKPEVITGYVLDAKSRFLKIVTIFKNPGTAPLTFELEDDARIDGGKEDLQKSPNGEAKSFWAYDKHWNQAYGLSVAAKENLPGDIQMNSDARTSTFKYKLADGKTEVTLAPGESFTFTRRLWAATNLLEVHALAHVDQASLKAVQLTVSDGGGKGLDHALVELIKEDGMSYGSARTDAMGKLNVSLPGENYSVRVTHLGRRLDQDDLRLVVKTNNLSLDWKSSDYHLGQIAAAITDVHGHPIPCKVEFRPLDGKPLDFGPETAEFAVKNLRYTPDGKFSQTLPVGEYDVLISHGPEYDLIKQKLTVEANKTATLAGKLVRSVDTTGWVSGDFHSHASPSGDNTSSQLGRVLNLVCEHIEFAPCTEHNRIDTYDPHIESLGIKKFLATVSGMELTGQPLPLNHQNSFPLKMTPRTQDNGAPLTADNLEDQIERLALWEDRSDKLVQVNHPDIGWMFYDKNGDGQPDGGYERAFPYMDVMEIHPVDSALHLEPVRTYPNGNKSHNTIFCWLQLLNQGYRIYGVMNTDAHYNYHGSGGIRSWIQSPTDDPAKIEFMEIVHASQEGRVMMSNGPFLEVWASEPGQSKKVTCGQDLVSKSKRVALKVKVQCPNWLDINRVFVLVNGRVSAKHDFSREKNSDLFHSGVVKFDETLELELDRDAHLIVVAGNAGGNLAGVWGDSKAEPAALTNPIYVDTDDDGFHPNKDTLGHPLPVKFGAGK